MGSLGRATSSVHSISIPDQPWLMTDSNVTPLKISQEPSVLIYILCFEQWRNMFHTVNRKMRIFIRKLLEKQDLSLPGLAGESDTRTY